MTTNLPNNSYHSILVFAKMKRLLILTPQYPVFLVYRSTLVKYPANSKVMEISAAMQ